MVLKKILLDELYCKLVFSIDKQRVLDDNKNFKKCYCCRNDKVKHIMCKVRYSPHYKYAKGDKEEYIKYMKSSGIYAGYRLEHNFNIYDDLIKNFDKRRLGTIKSILRSGKYILIDGVHRVSILLGDSEESVMVKVINRR